MGYRFTLETANIVANLTFGKVMSCFRGISDSTEQYFAFKYFIETFEQNFYSSNKHTFEDVRRIRNAINRYTPHSNEYDGIIDFEKSKHDYTVLNALHDMSGILSHCQVKSLLLPRAISQINKYQDDFMTSERMLHRLLNIPSNISYLVLQPQDRPNQDGVMMMDTFPNFDIALRQIDTWPAVMFWRKHYNRNEFVFVPVDNEKELLMLYNVLCYERSNPFGELKRIADSKLKKASYYVHLSDLHFGAKNTLDSERRLRSLVDKQLSAISDLDNIGFVITGDIVDSPKIDNKAMLLNFVEYIKSKSILKPLFVLGNHDINQNGLALTNNTQTVIDIMSGYPRIEIN